jgi:hypothetical protein
MTFYLVTKPCKYVANGEPHYHRVGDVVELDDHVAAYLVRRIKVTKAPKVPKQSIEEKYGALASYVDPLALLDHEIKLRETEPEPTGSNVEASKKGE